MNPTLQPAVFDQICFAQNTVKRTNHDKYSASKEHSHALCKFRGSLLEIPEAEV